VSLFSSVNGLQIVSGSLVIPLVGAWTADLHLAGDTPITGAVTVVIGNLTLAGTVYRSDVYGGQTHARLVGGAGGWRTEVPAQGYGSSSGVSLSAVLGDVAAAAGEQVNVSAPKSVGYGFARVAGVASDVLWQMLAQGLIASWYVDPGGVTQTQPWPATTVTSPLTVTAQSPDAGQVTVATEDYAAFLPGATFSAPQLAQSYACAGIHYAWDDAGKFRLDVLTSLVSGEDRVLGPIQQIVARHVAPTRFFGRYRYTITNASTTTIDGDPVDTTLGLPSLQNVPLLADSIASYVPPSGGVAHVMFADGVPTAPICVWTEADKGQGPQDVTLAPQGSPSRAVSGVNDTVIVMFPPLMQIAGSIGPAPFVGVLTITTPGVGVIQTGFSNTNAT
jgi:hypothetical protein